MNLNIYLILLIVLLIFNIVFWILVIWFRIFFHCGEGFCFRVRRGRNVGNRNRDESSGRSNPAYVDQEDPSRTPQRPFTIPEAMESPPSYEEAIKYDEFGFHSITGQEISSSLRSSSRNVISPDEEQSTNGVAVSSAMPTVPAVTDSTQTTPSTSLDNSTRPRCATIGHCVSTQLSTISEEDDDDSPVTVVVDSIGVQAARLLQNCDNKVKLTNCENLGTHSQC